MGDQNELLGQVEALFNDSDSTVLMAIKVSKSQTTWSLNTGRKGKVTSKPRILAISAKRSLLTQRFKVKIHVIKQVPPSSLQLAKSYKLKHLAKIDALETDKSGCTFVFTFDNIKSQSVSGSPPQWTTRSLDDRNHLLVCLMKTSKENYGKVPKIGGMDVVEITLWAQSNQKPLPIGKEGAAAAVLGRMGGDAGSVDVGVGVQQDLVSKAEEEDMEELLGTYVMGIDEAEAFSERLKRELMALEAANVHAILESEPLVEEVLSKLDAAASNVDDMDEWLNIFNVKLRHMREDIESIEARNNRLEMQAQNNSALLEELNRLLGRLRIPQEYAESLVSCPFTEQSMPRDMEACEWLTDAIAKLEPPGLDPEFAQMRAIREKKAELEKLKATFTRRASEFLRQYFSTLVEFMMHHGDAYFSGNNQLKRPDHSELRWKCRPYTHLLRHLKSLDKNSLTQLRKAYAHSVNLLLRREGRDFANELKAKTKVPRNTSPWLDSAASSSLNSPGQASETSGVSEAYETMLRVFIPLIADESNFFATFLCFDAIPVVTAAGVRSMSNSRSSRLEGLDDDGLLDDDEDVSPVAAGNDGMSQAAALQNAAELRVLNEALQELLDGVQEDFNSLVDWAAKIDPLRCIPMMGLTDKYLATHGADTSSFVHSMLVALQNRITQHFLRFVEEANQQIEKHDRGVKQMGILSFIPRFAVLASRMESLVQGGTREPLDQAYAKLVGTMFTVLERIAIVDPKHADVLLLENYAAFQNSMFEMANVVPTLARFYQAASEKYENACSRYINTIILYQFEKLFLFGERVENLLYTITPEEVMFQMNFSKVDLRKVVKATLTGTEKSLQTMYKRMQKNLTSEDLLPSLWDKCKDDFLEKYELLEQTLSRCYPNDPLSPSSAEMRDLFRNV
eukprot:TRINITY_DN4045_c0_g1_i1.p1 TRINITY_DN4045_c0_g1~~TRINITY_DN4045_c0_g1_i1.p1  ORF type:complete len:907 (-),score=229.59 TRINITY_DN4045_c0_g1_i1:206-2926(-)